MFVIYSVRTSQDEVIFTSWHYATVMDFKLNHGCNYTYTSNIPNNSMVEVICNNQATADTYRSMLRPQFRGARGMFVPKGRR